ncbi:MAG: sigma-70 family RNA polymerase sigma factor [Christensenellaceae bacterium]|nr:sigma-70 family RNA polymerase sigma factor [Christensenellaceae bacterium]
MDFESIRLKKLIANDPEKGIGLVIDLYGKQVKTICSNILDGYPDQDIEETVSQAFISLWECIDKYKPQKGCTLKSYLYGIARNTALMHRRSYPIDKVVPLDESIGGISEATDQQFMTVQDEKELHRAVADMEEPARTIFIMKYFYFIKNQEIAERLGISVKKVENTLFREKKKLRSILQARGVER